jgi:transcriptional regulator with XRE-family HTH domain
MIFAEAIRLYCREYKISTHKLESLTGVSHDTISRFLKGESIRSDHFTTLLTWTMQAHK